MFAKYGIKRVPKLVMRLPFTDNHYTAGIRSAFAEILSNTNLPQQVQKRVLAELRVVTTRRRSLADIFHNHRQFAKKYCVYSLPQCVCSFDDHRILLPEDFHEPARAVLSRKIFHALPQLMSGKKFSRRLRQFYARFQKYFVNQSVAPMILICLAVMTLSVVILSNVFEELIKISQRL
jgi:hypothetical protein